MDNSPLGPASHLLHPAVGCCHSGTAPPAPPQSGGTSGWTLLFPAWSFASSVSGLRSKAILTEEPVQQTWVKLKIFLVPRFLLSRSHSARLSFPDLKLLCKLYTLKCFLKIGKKPQVENSTPGLRVTNITKLFSSSAYKEYICTIKFISK